MTDNEIKRRKAICAVAGVDEIGKLSDGFHTFNSLYEQRMILFAALVKAYKNQAWKSYRHEDGEYCFGGGWFIVGIDTPEGSYTYHYENKYWNMFECVDLPRAKHWDGHTEEDAEIRLMSLEPQRWVPCSERPPKEGHDVLITKESFKIKGYEQEVIKAKRSVDPRSGKIEWWSPEFGALKNKAVLAWMPLPAPYRKDGGKQ